MTVTLTNHQIPTDMWERVFSRDQLRSLARKHGIARGQNKRDTAYYLHRGLTHGMVVTTFTVELTIDL